MWQMANSTNYNIVTISPLRLIKTQTLQTNIDQLSQAETYISMTCPNLECCKCFLLPPAKRANKCQTTPFSIRQRKGTMTQKMPVYIGCQN